MASETQTCAIGILANRPNAQESDSPLHKPPIQPIISMNYNLFMQNKANLRRAKMNTTFCVTKDYENRWQRPVRKNKPKQSQFQIGRMK
jgi:hypothetical protein